jgi:hypothetical protein
LNSVPFATSTSRLWFPRSSAVLRVAQIDDARVAARVLAADLSGGIRGRVVGDDQLEVVEALAQDRVDRLANEPLSVEDRQTDAEPHDPLRTA